MPRIAEPGEGIGLDELALATRNHGMPLEALRYDVTPPGPALRPHALRHPRGRPGDLAAGDRRGGRPAARLGLDELMRRPAVTARVLLECAGNGRARYEPRPGQPAVAARGRRQRGVDRDAPRPRCWRRPGSPRAVDVAFTGADHGVERGVEQDYARGLPLAEALRPRRPAGVGHERRAAAPRSTALRCGCSCPAGTGWRRSSGSTRIDVLDRAVHRLPERHRLPAEGRRPRGRRAGDPHPAARPCSPRPAGRTS